MGDDERISDVDRDRAVELLRHGVGGGLLDLAEFSDRVDLVLKAKTWGQAEAVLAEFPGLTLREPEPPTLTLQTTNGSVKHDGVWTVPSRIVARCGSGRIRIDFTQATCRHREVELQAVCEGSGQVHLVVPPGWCVRVEELRATSGRVIDKLTHPHTTGSPLIRVSGDIASGRLKIRH